MLTTKATPSGSNNPSSERRAYRRRIYERYHSTTVAFAPRRMARADMSAHFGRQLGAHLPAPGRSLDLGCGAGEFVIFLQSRGWQAEGLDLSPEQVELAHRAGATGVRLGDLFTDLEARHEAYDLVTAFNVLEHLDRDELLELMDRVTAALRPGGRFIAMVPNAKGLFGANVRFADLTHELSFTPISVNQLCTVVGLRVLAVLENGPIVHGLPSAIRWAVWQVVRGGLLVARLAEGADASYPVFTQDLLFIAERPPSRP